MNFFLEIKNKYLSLYPGFGNESNAPGRFPDKTQRL